MILKKILLFTRVENNYFFFSQSVFVLYKTEWLHQVPVGKQAMLSYLTSCRHCSIRELVHQAWAQYCGITTSSIFSFIFSMFKSVQLPAETAEPMTFMKSVTVILEFRKVVFCLVLPANGPDGGLVLVYCMTNQITRSISALCLWKLWVWTYKPCPGKSSK